NVKVNDEIMLIRKSETEFLAVKTICTHKGCDVDLEGSKFVCPCHGSEYTLEGKVTQGPSKSDLKTYETSYDADKNTVTVMMGGKKEMKKEEVQKDSTKTIIDSTKVKDK